MSLNLMSPNPRMVKKVKKKIRKMMNPSPTKVMNPNPPNQDPNPSLMTMPHQRPPNHPQPLSSEPVTTSSPDKLVEVPMDSNTKESHHPDSPDQVTTNLPNP